LFSVNPGTKVTKPENLWEAAIEKTTEDKKGGGGDCQLHRAKKRGNERGDKPNHVSILKVDVMKQKQLINNAGDVGGKGRTLGNWSARLVAEWWGWFHEGLVSDKKANRGKGKTKPWNRKNGDD